MSFIEKSNIQCPFLRESTIGGSTAHFNHPIMHTESFIGMVEAAGQFYYQLELIGAKATTLPGAVRKLGESMMEMVEGHKDIANHHADWVRLLMITKSWQMLTLFCLD